MYRDKTIAVIVPAYNEEKLIGKVLKTTPEFVDHIIVVDDASLNRTGEVVKSRFVPSISFSGVLPWGKKKF